MMIKVGIPPCKKHCFSYFNESPFKIIKNAFYFIFKALFIFRLSKVLSWFLGHVETAT